MANKVSFRTELTPIPILPLWRVPWRFHGYSSIWDSDGTARGELVDVEEALVAEVTLDAAAKRRPAPSTDHYFSFPPPLVAPLPGPLLRGLAHLGQRSYHRNERRVQAARRITGGHR